jgi:hypothetical protein
VVCGNAFADLHLLGRQILLPVFACTVLEYQPSFESHAKEYINFNNKAVYRFSAVLLCSNPNSLFPM